MLKKTQFKASFKESSLKFVKVLLRSLIKIKTNHLDRPIIFILISANLIITQRSSQKTFLNLIKKLRELLMNIKIFIQETSYLSRTISLTH